MAKGFDAAQSRGETTMLATYLPPVKTPLPFETAAHAMRVALASVLGEQPSRETLALALGKTALETGRWSAMWNGNWGNVKHSDSRPGFFTAIVLNEVIDGKVVWFDPRGRLTGNPAKGGRLAGDLADEGRAVPPGHPQTRMRAFTSAGEGALDYVKFVARGRYAGAWALLLEGDAEGYVHELKRKGYFTADEGEYRKGVVSLQREFVGKLGGLDVVETPVPPVEVVREWLSPQDLNLLDVAFDARRFQIAEENRRDALREMSGFDPDPPLLDALDPGDEPTDPIGPEVA
jgi:hypothetical protein